MSRAAGEVHNPLGHHFVLPHNPGQDFQNQDGWRFCIKCHGMISMHAPDILPGVAPVVVDNVELTSEPGLPQQGRGVVMFSKGFWLSGGKDPGMRVAWMPLHGSSAPRLQDLQYYTGRSESRWSPDPDQAGNLFSFPEEHHHWSSVSALWVKDARLWVLVYCDAEDSREHMQRFERPVFARISPTLSGLRDAKEIVLFDPWREGAYGTYANKPNFGTFPADVPPLPPPIGGNPDPAPPRENLPVWAYGAFLIERFTTWDSASQLLDLYYLLSLGRPYQVQLFHSQLRNHTHAIWACDFLHLHDLFFRQLFVIIITELDSRRIVHVGVTRATTDAWVAQQLREATPFGVAPNYLIRDNDAEYGSNFTAVAVGTGIEVLRTPGAPREKPFKGRSGKRGRKIGKRDNISGTIVVFRTQ